MIRLFAAAGCAALMLSACASTEDDADAPPAMGDDGPAQCKADQHQDWVGRNRSELPPAPAGETWRVTCTECPVTMDYNPNRLNVFYDQETGVIEEVRCG